MEVIVSEKAEKYFHPLFEESQGKSLHQLLNEFQMLREKNIEYLRAKNITKNILNKTGIHPDFGEVTLAQLLSARVVHGLNHIAQISRVIARQYKDDVGPWLEYLGILKNK